MESYTVSIGASTEFRWCYFVNNDIAIIGSNFDLDHVVFYENDACIRVNSSNGRTLIQSINVDRCNNFVMMSDSGTAILWLSYGFYDSICTFNSPFLVYSGSSLNLDITHGGSAPVYDFNGVVDFVAFPVY